MFNKMMKALVAKYRTHFYICELKFSHDTN